MPGLGVAFDELPRLFDNSEKGILAWNDFRISFPKRPEKLAIMAQGSLFSMEPPETTYLRTAPCSVSYSAVHLTRMKPGR